MRKPRGKPKPDHMRKDLSKLLNDWPFEPDQVKARLITGDDGAPYLQIRVEMGILQMHLEGRPDGQTPDGYPSLLDAAEARLEDSKQSPNEERFSLSPDQCRALRDEATQFYQRYVALMVIEDYERVVRDTTRNLRLLDFFAAHAETEADRSAMEQFRPYILMMRARAMASLCLTRDEPKAAILAIDEGLESLRRYFAEAGQPHQYEDSTEVRLLRGMRDALVPKLPVSQTTELRRRLDAALEQENYELAAILRDELKALRDREPKTPGDAPG